MNSISCWFHGSWLVSGCGFTCLAVVSRVWAGCCSRDRPECIVRQHHKTRLENRMRVFSIVLGLSIAFLFGPSASAQDAASGDVLASCWMEGAHIHCQRHPGPWVTATLSVEFVSHSRTIDSELDCCGIDPLSADLSPRTDCTACEVRNIIGIPVPAFPVNVTLTATSGTLSWTVGPIPISGENAITADAPIQVVRP